MAVGKCFPDMVNVPDVMSAANPNNQTAVMPSGVEPNETIMPSGEVEPVDTWYNEGTNVPDEYVSMPETTDEVEGSDAVLKLAGETNKRLTIYEVKCTFSDTPPDGSTVKVESPRGTTIWGPMPVTQSGYTPFAFEKGLKGKKSQDLVVTLSGGGELGRVEVSTQPQE